MIINKRVTLDYFIMVLFIGLSGVPYLVTPKLNILQMAILIPIFILRKKVLNTSFFFLFIILFGLTLLQGLKFSFFPVMTNIGLYMLVLSAYLTVKILGENFVKYYINVMYYIALISLPIYFSILLIPSLGTFLVHSIVPLFNVLNLAHSVHQTIIIYNLSHIDIFRNSGPFWEPGAYAGYLLVTFILNTIQEKKLLEKKNIVFVITIITTLSTTAYISLFIFLFFLYFKLIKNIFFKILVIVSIVSIAFFAFISLDFIGSKVETRLNDLKDPKVLYSRNSGRFVSILRDMIDLKGHEFVGRGRSNLTRYEPTTGSIVVRSAGLTDIIVKYGIFFFIIILYYLFKSIKNYISSMGDRKYQNFLSFGIVVTLLVTLISETYFNYAIYWSLLFLRYSYIGKKEVEV